MNEIEFRKRCIINPGDPDPAFQAALDNADYRRLIDQIRETIPGVSIGTDIIVGFPAPSPPLVQIYTEARGLAPQ